MVPNMADRFVTSQRVVTPEGLRPAAVRVRDGRIEEVLSEAPRGRGAEILDFGDSVVFPGLVDTHVHVNDPGRAHWEGFTTATAAAAAGGVTTLLDMPLNSIPPTTSVAALGQKRRALAAAGSPIDVGFWGGAVPGNADDLPGLAAAGVFGFKCFLAPSGVPEFEAVNEGQLRAAMERIAALGTVLLVHAEDPAELRPFAGPARSYESYLATRPAAAEARAIRLVLRLALETGARVHVLHLSDADSLPMIEQARAGGARVTVETCPHYLFFAAEEIADGDTALKCAPPIRGWANRERLWEGLLRGAIDLVVSDHSPAPPEVKELASGDFSRAWGGIASLELTLAAVWTAASARGVPVPVERLAGWMSEAPARFAGLDDRGALAPGLVADLVVWDPEASRTIDPASLFQRHPVTPYAGRELVGVVRATFRRGEKIFEDGRLLVRSNGEELRRK
jgi:allantoinase